VYKILILSLFISSCFIRTKVPALKNTCDLDNKTTFWDPYFTYSNKRVGWGLYIISSTKLVQYEYVDSVERVIMDYGDIDIDTISWNLSNDTIYIGGKMGSYYILKISKCKNDTLELLDCKGNAVRPQLLFLKSRDQTTPLKNKYQ
jgi:hypothetical protein